MGRTSDTRFLVLHGLRLKGFGEPAAVAAAVGLDEATVEEHLAKLQAEEFAVRREGRLAGWSLTRAGRAEQEQRAADDLAASASTEAVAGAYRRFLELNVGMLTVCTDWQVRDGATPNDHADAGYDAAVVARLRSIHDAVLPIVADLAGALDRYAHYAPRLTTAVERVEAGEREYFTKPIIDSYHTIWFELHEDLLTSLGIERSQEA